MYERDLHYCAKISANCEVSIKHLLHIIITIPQRPYGDQEELVGGVQ